MEICRACLSTDGDMLPLDDNFVKDYNTLTNLNISLNDEFPQYSCKLCMEAVKNFINFKEKCVLNESALRAVKIEEVKPEKSTFLGFNINDADHVNEDVTIKVEPESVSDSYIQGDFDFDDIGFLIKDETQGFKPRKCRKVKKKKKKRLHVQLKLEQKTEPIKEEYIQLLYCGLCIKTFIDENIMSNHIETHRKDRRCEICTEMFVDWPQLVGHRLVHLPDKQKHCHVCPKRFLTTEGMEHHYIRIHYEQKNLGVQCKECPSRFETPRKLRKHMYSVHSTRTYICDYCSKRSNNKQKLAIHIQSHSEKKIYTCDLCGFSCKYSGGLKNHKVRKHSLIKVYCKRCKRAFHGEEEREKHRCNAPIRICPICGKQFSTSNSYTRHAVSHQDVGQYKCDRCPAVYKYRNALLVHLDRHDDNRTKQCEYCPAKFFSLSVLIKHRRTHTGEKPYVCRICHKGFTGNNNLKVHMKVHGEMLIVKKNKEIEDLNKNI